jgi:hypothetical protein
MIELLAFLPLLLLVCALVAGRYPGERLLMELRRGRASRPIHPPPPLPAPPTALPTRLPRGSTLIGAFLAGRAPPLPPQRPT